jgi:uncharacterized membrane protein YjjP (DUF1212 family)
MVESAAAHDSAASGDLRQPARVLRIAMRTAVALLSSGAQSDDVQAAISTITTAYGLHNVQGSVTFSGISISYDQHGHDRPLTLLHIVRDRTSDFNRLASATALVRQIRDGKATVDEAETELDELEQLPAPFGRVVRFVAPGVSAAASTIIFGGNGVDAAATMAIAFLVQPGLASLDRSSLPPFFRLAFGAGGSALLVALFVGLNLPIVGGLVLTGSLLRFLPGYALVSGLRDLIDQSMISGTARLAEAVMLAAAIAGGTTFALAIAGSFGIQLSIVTVGRTDWGPVVGWFAALVAVGTFAIRLGVPPNAVGQAAILGAFAWTGYLGVSGVIEPSIAVLGSAIAIGIAGRVLALRAGAPSVLWVVPAILPLLPGLAIVTAMLARTEQAQVAGLLNAVGTAFLIGTGVASGDIVVSLVVHAREQFVAPAVRAVANDIDVLIVTPVERVVTRGRRDSGAADEPESD